MIVPQYIIDYRDNLLLPSTKSQATTAQAEPKSCADFSPKPSPKRNESLERVFADEVIE
jgi:hypothetical protein